MHLVIRKATLLGVLANMRNIISVKSGLDTLSAVLIEANQESGVKITATDLRITLECALTAEVVKDGRVAVRHRTLQGLISEFPDGEITLALQDEGVLQISCNGIETRLYTERVEDYPPVLRDLEGGVQISMAQGTLGSLLRRVSYACSQEDGRYNLTGVLLETKEKLLNAVATDGRRLSIAQTEQFKPGSKDVRVILPSKTVHELERLLGEEGAVTVTITENQVMFQFDDIRLGSNVIEATYPNYEAVIPKKHDKIFEVETRKFSESIRRARQVRAEPHGSVRLQFTDDGLTVRAEAPQVGEYKEQVGGEYKGAPVELAFNPDYILDVLNRVDTDSVFVALKDSNSPAVIRPLAEEPVESYTNIVMPMRA
jgi:DNA polymerase-3 subunit beta